MRIIKQIDKAGRICLPKDIIKEANAVNRGNYYIDLDGDKIVLSPVETTKACYLTEEEVNIIKTVFENAKTFGIVSEKDEEVINSLPEF